MNYIITLALALFVIGILGLILNRRNVLITLMSIELLLFAINLILITTSIIHDDLIGQLLTLLVLTVAAAESAIGLAILVTYYRLRGTISIASVHLLKG